MKEELNFTNIGNKESQKKLIKEIMDLDAKDGLYENDVEKLVSKEKAFDGVTVECTLYTEEQVREAMSMARKLSGVAYTNDEIIQSLKQNFPL